MKTSQKGIELIKEFEGFKPEAYICPAGVLTIGYGHTKGVKAGQSITERQAEQFLKEDLADAENVVMKYAGKSAINQNRFDALVSFVFNLGERNFKISTLLKIVRKTPESPCIRAEFEKWIYSNGNAMNGLLRRRKAEAELYFAK
jgi:lysozyme